MRYELTDDEWAAIGPMLPSNARGVPREDDRRVLNGIFWVLRAGAPDFGSLPPVSSTTVISSELTTCFELERISDVAPTEEGARKAILKAAIKACWRFDPELQRWLCPDCVRARDASEVPADVARAPLANAGHDTRAPQAWLGHRNLQHTVRYTELALDRFKDFWRS
jgi:hypothetical protein